MGQSTKYLKRAQEDRTDYQNNWALKHMGRGTRPPIEADIEGDKEKT